jgi:hypothetical protein
MELAKYEDIDIANGDPVIVVGSDYPHMQTIGKKLISLGTGFDSDDELVDQLEHTVQTGNSTQDIPQECADRLEDAGMVEIFTPVGVLSVTTDE